MPRRTRRETEFRLGRTPMEQHIKRRAGHSTEPGHRPQRAVRIWRTVSGAILVVGAAAILVWLLILL